MVVAQCAHRWGGRAFLPAVLRAAKIIDTKRDNGDQEWSP
jgi:hypothetical protein